MLSPTNIRIHTHPERARRALDALWRARSGTLEAETYLHPQRKSFCVKVGVLAACFRVGIGVITDVPAFGVRNDAVCGEIGGWWSCELAVDPACLRQRRRSRQ